MVHQERGAGKVYYMQLNGFAEEVFSILQRPNTYTRWFACVHCCESCRDNVLSIPVISCVEVCLPEILNNSTRREYMNIKIRAAPFIVTQVHDSAT